MPPPPLSRKNGALAWLKGDMLIAVIVLLPSIIAVAIFIYGFIVWTGLYLDGEVEFPHRRLLFRGAEELESSCFEMDRFHWNLRNLVLYAIGFMGQCIVFGFLIAVLLDQQIQGVRHCSARSSFSHLQSRRL